MTLHPMFVAVCFIIFGVMCAMVMLNMFKQRKLGLAGFMAISTVVMFVSAWISSTVPAA
jgi:hypothetical protein